MKFLHKGRVCYLRGRLLKEGEFCLTKTCFQISFRHEMLCCHQCQRGRLLDSVVFDVTQMSYQSLDSVYRAYTVSKQSAKQFTQSTELRESIKQFTMSTELTRASKGCGRKSMLTELSRLMKKKTASTEVTRSSKEKKKKIASTELTRSSKKTWRSQC